jgi:hypothetical protein
MKILKQAHGLFLKTSGQIVSDIQRPYTPILPRTLSLYQATNIKGICSLDGVSFCSGSPSVLIEFRAQYLCILHDLHQSDTNFTER